MVFLFLNIGGSELFIIILAIVILFGAKRIPEIARGLGKGIKEIKNATSDIQEEIRRSSAEITERADISKPKPKKTTTNKDETTEKGNTEVEVEEKQNQPENTTYRDRA